VTSTDYIYDRPLSTLVRPDEDVVHAAMRLEDEADAAGVTLDDDMTEAIVWRVADEGWCLDCRSAECECEVTP